MVIKRIDVVEHLSGRGIVFEKDGEKLGEANYEIDELQTIIDVGTQDDPDAELEGLKETGGRFFDFDLTAAMIEGKPLPFISMMAGISISFRTIRRTSRVRCRFVNEVGPGGSSNELAIRPWTCG